MQLADSPPSRRSLSLRPLAALLVVGLFVVLQTRTGMDRRLWSHLAYGRWIIDTNPLLFHADPVECLKALGTGQGIAANPDVLETDHLGHFTHPDLAYVDPSWQSRVILARTCRVGEDLAGDEVIPRMEGGVEMLRLLHALLALLFAVLLLLAYRRQCGSLPLACVGLVLLTVVSPPVPGPLRPEVFGQVCFAAVLLILTGPRVSWWALLIVPTIFAFWVNLHGSFLPGLMLLFVFFLGRILDVCIKASSWNVLRPLKDAQVWLLFFVLLLSAYATLLNPWGADLYRRMPDLIAEYVKADMPGWRPLDFSQWEPRSFFLLGSLVLITLTQAISARPFRASHLLLVLSFAVLPLFLSRLMVWWFPLLPWLLLPYWATALERRAQSAEREEQDAESRAAGAKGRWTILAAVVLVAGFGYFLLPVSWLWTGSPRPLSETLSADTPWRVAERLHKEGDFKGVIFTTTTTGDFLLWALPREWPVFMFSEIQYYGGIWQDYLAVRKPDADWWEVLDRLKVNLIVIDRKVDSALAAALAKDTAWEIVEGEASAGTGLLVAFRKIPLE